jgi:rare lipoprotein A
MLDYTSTGTAKVKVEYVGRAPLDGRDESYLMASYRPGNKAPDPSDGLPTGVMIAMNGTTPSGSGEVPAVAFPGTLTDTAPAAGVAVATAGFPDLPAFGPIVPERPDSALDSIDSIQMAIAMSYAPEARRPATRAFDAFGEGGSVMPAAPAATPFVAAATLATVEEAAALKDRLAGFGRVELETCIVDGTTMYSVNLFGDGRSSTDELLAGAWANGAPDAIVVRD